MLRQKLSNVEIPLKAISVEGNLVDVIAEVTMKQTYHNSSEIPIEAVFKFPLDGMSAVCYCEAIINGTSVVAKVKENEAAKAEYDDAISAGKGAYLLEKEQGDVFSMSVGNLPPGQEVVIKITYITELATEGTTNLQFILPTTLLMGNNAPAPHNVPVSNDLPYKLEVILNVEMPSNITEISFPNHPDLRAEVAGCHATFSNSNVEMGRDFKVAINLGHIESHIWIEASPNVGDPFAFMMTMRPQLDFEESKSQVIFLIDRSGSMAGTSIASARETLFTALKHLPEDCLFNIYGFGTSYLKLFDDSKRCDLKSIYEARKAIGKIDSDMGGTELYAPLLDALTVSSTLPKVIFLISDGAVNNTAQVCDLVSTHIGPNKDCRVFTFGIGSGVDMKLMQDLAKLGQGTCTEISQIDSEFEKKIIGQVNFALRPAFQDVTIDWGKSGAEILQAPLNLPPIFSSQLYTIYGLVKSPDWSFESVDITATGNAGQQKFTITASNATYKSGLQIHRLAARASIREMEESGSSKIAADVSKKEIIRISTLYNLASSHTSFLGIEDRNHTHTTSSMQLYKVPTPAVTHASRTTSKITIQSTGCVAWRRSDIKYKKNEIFIDMVEHQDILISADGNIIKSMLKDSIKLLCYLSGMPEIKLALDDRMDRAENLRFHQCVKLSRYDTDRVISMVPPDGQFELLCFVQPDESTFQPLYIVTATIERFPGNKIMYHIRIKANYVSSMTGKLEVVVPVPPDACTPAMTVTPNRGTLIYRPEKDQMIFSASGISGETNLVIGATFKLPSVQDDTPYKMPPIFVNYEIPYATPSMPKMKYLKVIERSNYEVSKAIRYICQGQQEIRTKEILHPLYS